MKHLESIMIVAGEPSGDLHASKLVRELRAALPDRDLVFFGCAGPRMREEGVEAVAESDALAIMGVPEIAAALPMFFDVFTRLKRAAAERRPDVVILVDFPECNLKLARSLKKLGCRVVYYISPQLWAWRKYRVRTIRKYVDLLLTILPFEKDWYKRHGVGHVEYVGSPLTNEVRAATSRDRFRDMQGIGAGVPFIALLPGSRSREVARIFPIMVQAAARIKQTRPEAQFVVAAAHERASRQISEILERSQVEMQVALEATYEVLNAADAAAVASGTATLETGILGTPMVIVYKTSSLNYRLVRPLISVEHFGLINLIAGKRIVSELIQDDLTPASLAAELQRLLEPQINAELRRELNDASAKLGEGGASTRAAAAIIRHFG